MNKPIYDLSVGDDGADSPLFPPPVAPAAPASYASAPPPGMPAAAPAPWPAFDAASPAAPTSTVHSLDDFPPPASQPTPSAPSAPAHHDPFVAASMPNPPAWGAPTAAPAAASTAAAPAAAAAPAPAAPAFAAPAPTAAPVYELPVQTAPTVPVSAPAPTVPMAAPAPTVSAAAPVSPALNFPPPTIAAPAPSFLPPAAAAAPQPEVDYGEDMGFADADPDLTSALREVLMRGASDLHVSAKVQPMVRIDGSLVPTTTIEGIWDAAKVSKALRSIMTESQQEQFDRELELDFAYTVSANARFRVNIYQQREAMGAAFRLIPTDIKKLEDLGVPDSVAGFAKLARGLVLVTGPTGSGKSTTLAALVDLVNRTRADHIVTVEDPIEFMHQNHRSIVNQREIGADTHSFQNALKHVLRQDPDVILIGELRDHETISVALTAAETGHLVFATLHTKDAAQTIDRVIDVFPPHQQGQVRSQLAAVLCGVVCQTLVKKASGKGRAVATEVLIATPAIANLIREGKTYQIASAMQAGGDLGMHTMDRHLADLANTGIITQDAAIEKAQDVEGLKQMIHRVETPADAAGRAMSQSTIDFEDAFSEGAH